MNKRWGWILTGALLGVMGVSLLVTVMGDTTFSWSRPDQAGTLTYTGLGLVDPVISGSVTMDGKSLDVAAIALASGKMIIGDAGGTGSVFSVAGNIQSLLGAANYAAARALLDLEVGVDFNAYDADLATWATVTPSANGKSLVAGVDYATMRGLLDLEVNTDFNAYDADLTTYAGISPSLNVQSVLGAVDYAAVRTLLNVSQTGALTTEIPSTFQHIYVVAGEIASWD